MSDSPHTLYMRMWAKNNPLKVSLYNAIRQARKRAEKKGVPFKMDGGSAAHLLVENEGKCALSGITFRPTPVKGHPGPYSPSLDRIRPELGYVQGNVRLILNGLNALRGNGDDEDVIAICRAVMEKNNDATLRMGNLYRPCLGQDQ